MVDMKKRPSQAGKILKSISKMRKRQEGEGTRKDVDLAAIVKKVARRRMDNLQAERAEEATSEV